jgi:hypothetical protein
MKQDAFLQGSQRIDVLHVDRAAGHCGNNPLDLRGTQVEQWQHSRRDRLASRWDTIGWHRYIQHSGTLGVLYGSCYC